MITEVHYINNSVISIHLSVLFNQFCVWKMHFYNIHFIIATVYLGAEFVMASLPGVSRWDAHAEALQKVREAKVCQDVGEDKYTISGDLDYLNKLLSLDYDLRSTIKYLEYQEERAQFLRSKLYLFRDERPSDHDFTQIDRHLSIFYDGCQVNPNFGKFGINKSYDYITILPKNPFEKRCGSEEGVKIVQKKWDSLVEGYAKLIRLKLKVDLECKEIKAMWDELPEDDRRKHDEGELWDGRGLVIEHLQGCEVNFEHREKLSSC